MDFNKKNIRIIIGILFGAILFFWALQHMSDLADALGYIAGLLTPFIMGAVIAFILNVPMKSIEGRLFNRTEKLARARRPISYVVTLILVFGIITLAMYVIIPQLADTMVAIAEQVPAALDTAQNFIDSKMQYLTYIKGFADDISFDWQGLTKKLVTMLQNGASGLINSGVGAVSGIVNGLVSFFIGFIFSIYLLMQKEKLARQGKQSIYALFKESAADRIIYIMSLSNNTFSKFISGQCLEAVIIGILFFITMIIFRLPYALLISVTISLTALIPMVGAFIGCAIGALLILMVSPVKSLLFIIMFLVLQQLEGNLIYPHVVGGSIGLPSVWVLVAVTVGGKTMGVFGMLLFIPLCSVLYALFRTYVYERLEEKRISPLKWLGSKEAEKLDE